MAVLEVEGLSKRFGRLTVADGLSFSVEEGQTVGIVGPNGAGKSTLFAMLSGELRPDAGTVRFADVDLHHLSAGRRARLGIGRTFQVPRPFEGLTVFENLLVCAQEGAGARGSAARASALEILEATGLLDDANLPAARLTLLQRKRLELARAWATDPRLILLDEVAGGLTDPEVDELIGVVRQLTDRGIAVLWIEHVVRALTETVSHLMCLAGGHFVAQGSPRDVLADPQVRRLYLGEDDDVADDGDLDETEEVGR